MSVMASQITSLTIAYSIFYLSADQRKHQSSALLAFVRRIHRRLMNSLHKGPVMQKMFPFNDVIMTKFSSYWSTMIFQVYVEESSAELMWNEKWILIGLASLCRAFWPMYKQICEKLQMRLHCNENTHTMKPLRISHIFSLKKKSYAVSLMSIMMENSREYQTQMAIMSNTGSWSYI